MSPIASIYYLREINRQPRNDNSVRTGKKKGVDRVTARATRQDRQHRFSFTHTSVPLAELCHQLYALTVAVRRGTHYVTKMWTDVIYCNGTQGEKEVRGGGNCLFAFKSSSGSKTYKTHGWFTAEYFQKKAFSFLLFRKVSKFKILKTILQHAGLIWGFHNPPNRCACVVVFNVRMWSFCMRIHTGSSVYSLIQRTFARQIHFTSVPS